VPDASLDYVYVDARHDYCGVKEDLEAWWPKLRRGGILAGHDYLDAAEVRAKPSPAKQDWACEAGAGRGGGWARQQQERAGPGLPAHLFACDRLGQRGGCACMPDPRPPAMEVQCAWTAAGTRGR
jgi:hypothetical protein